LLTVVAAVEMVMVRVVDLGLLMALLQVAEVRLLVPIRLVEPD
jgi:hypothetical protein